MKKDRVKKQRGNPKNGGETKRDFFIESWQREAQKLAPKKPETRSLQKRNRIQAELTEEKKGKSRRENLPESKRRVAK